MAEHGGDLDFLRKIGNDEVTGLVIGYDEGKSPMFRRVAQGSAIDMQVARAPAAPTMPSAIRWPSTSAAEEDVVDIFVTP